MLPGLVIDFTMPNRASYNRFITMLVQAKKVLVISNLLLLAGMALAREEAIPQAYPVERYAPLWNKSPFALSSAAVPEAPPAGFADNLALTGVLKIGDEVLVSVVDKITKERQMLSAKAESQGIWVEQLDLSTAEPDQLTVTLKKGAESAVLRYDMDYLRQVAAVSAPAAAPAASKPSQQTNSGSTANLPKIMPPPNRPSGQHRIILPSQSPSGITR